ncbi:hypothetical protein NQ317_007892 [Molorchus minor]|uniref:Uncharacterized protein n=1 Tax=Molorchus minor TaxID=1323400 RepID=A0ABQ9JTB8_9CUCU|nr:hypothetical protein NQ317_007892 [Molorchus minor]
MELRLLKKKCLFEVVENNLDDDCVMDIKIEEIKTVTEDDDSNSVLDNKSCSSTDEPISNDSKN